MDSCQGEEIQLCRFLLGCIWKRRSLLSWAWRDLWSLLPPPWMLPPSDLLLHLLTCHPPSYMTDFTLNANRVTTRAVKCLRSGIAWSLQITDCPCRTCCQGNAPRKAPISFHHKVVNATCSGVHNSILREISKHTADTGHKDNFAGCLDCIHNFFNSAKVDDVECKVPQKWTIMPPMDTIENKGAYQHQSRMLTLPSQCFRCPS